MSNTNTPTNSNPVVERSIVLDREGYAIAISLVRQNGERQWASLQQEGETKV